MKKIIVVISSVLCLSACVTADQASRTSTSDIMTTQVNKLMLHANDQATIGQLNPNQSKQLSRSPWPSVTTTITLVNRYFSASGHHCSRIVLSHTPSSAKLPSEGVLCQYDDGQWGITNAVSRLRGDAQ